MRENENEQSRTEEKCSDLLLLSYNFKAKDSDDTSVYDIQQIVAAFSKLLLYTTTKDLTNRKKDITSSEKVVWLDSYEDLKNGNYNIIFKSAK